MPFENNFNYNNALALRLSALEATVNKLTTVKLTVWKKDSSAFDLYKPNPNDACYDVCAVHDVEIPALGRSMVDTGLVMAVPSHCEIQVRPRSGISANCAFRNKGQENQEPYPSNLTIHLGTGDAGYRDSYRVIVENGNSFPVLLKRGDRIAQIAVRVKPDVQEVYVSSFDELPESDGRGMKGFGSSGSEVL